MWLEDAKAEPAGIDHEIGDEDQQLEADVVFTQGGEDASKHGGAPFSQDREAKRSAGTALTHSLRDGASARG